ncbi:hypothetical protein BASA81_000418 [Batrachochytrium salamandrivorans]|nr:hypothetical protein BASA81_000418 [Batrachochytrium salamandrivorans]
MVSPSSSLASATPTSTTTSKRKRVITASIPEGPKLDDFMLESHKSPAPSSLSSLSSPIATLTRTALVFFFVGFIWHSTILPFVYTKMGTKIAAWIAMSGSHVDAFRDPNFIDPKVMREFGLAGAASHTIIFMFGFVCATFLRTIRFSSIVRNRGGGLEPMAIGVSIVLVVWTAAVFHVLAQAFCRYAFETKFGPIYHYATLFYEETNGKTPFAWASSVSFTTALLLGFLLSTDFSLKQFERMLTKVGMLNPLALMLPFAVWLGLLDSVLIPLFSQTLINLGLNDDAVSGGHAFSFAIGLVMMLAGGALFTEDRCGGVCSVASSQTVGGDDDDGGEGGEGSNSQRTFDLTNLGSIAQSISLTILFSGTLLSSVLLTREEQWFAFEWLINLLLRPAVALPLSMLVGMGWYFVKYLANRDLTSMFVDFCLDETWPRRRRTVTYMLLTGLWNVHMFPFFGCWAPFHLFAYVLQRPELYSQTNAFADGFMYVFSGPYLGPVVIQGVLKILCARFKWNWGLVQESVLAILVLLPPSLTMYVHWREGHIALPLYITMSCLELVYLLTWRSRPEYSGVRDWPALKQSRIWKLIQDYFSVQFVLDGFTELDPTRPRVIGFHPHGLFPCTVVWMHLIPLWKETFGFRLIPKQLTDAFTHVPPGMREVMQWSGGREITRNVMTSLLGENETLIIVPGGQSEMMMHTPQNFKNKKMMVCAKHRGFLRIAMETKAEVVPCISFGELVAIKNVELPTIQNFLQRLVGVPAPFLPVGIKGWLPVPAQTPFTIVFGKPITLFCDLQGEGTEEDVELAHKLYFTQTRELFEKHKHAAGYGEWTLGLKGFD